MGTAQAISVDRRRDKLVGLAIIVSAFAGCMGLSVWGMKVSTPRPAPEPAPISQKELPGFPDKVEPFVVLARARELSVREKFRGFVARGVNSDGTVDLTDTKNSIRYSFQSDSGHGPQPERDPGTLPERRYCGVQHVTVEKPGIVAKADNARRSCGSKEIEQLSEPPACSLRDLWKYALKNKFSKNAPARVEFFPAESGAAYRMSQGKYSFVLSARDCRTELKGRSGRGSIP